MEPNPPTGETIYAVESTYLYSCGCFDIQRTHSNDLTSSLPLRLHCAKHDPSDYGVHRRDQEQAWSADPETLHPDDFPF